MTLLISSFDGEHRFLSNFFPCNVCLTDLEGPVWYKSVEHAYQASKTLNTVQRDMIRLVDKPWKAKKLGKAVTLREDWTDEFKIQIMEGLLRQKFDHFVLGSLLLETHPATLIEGNWHKDTFWGVCNGSGRNELGKLLMAIRSDLRSHA